MFEPQRTGHMQQCIVRRTIGTASGNQRRKEEKNKILSVDMFLCMSVVLSKSQQRPFDI